MLEKTIKLFKQNYPQYNKIFLNVQTTNNKAINLYQKFNFRIKEEIPRYYYSGEDSYLMELII
ncbi:MAG: GNAT family N-acetyltransferase [Candidatus Lokiarchaeota archaeon]